MCFLLFLFPFLNRGTRASLSALALGKCYCVIPIQHQRKYEHIEVKVAARQLQRWGWISGAPGFWDNAIREYAKRFPQGSIIGTFATYPAK